MTKAERNALTSQPWDATAHRRPRGTVATNPARRAQTVVQPSTGGAPRKPRATRGQGEWGSTSMFYRTASTHDARWSRTASERIV